MRSGSPTQPNRDEVADPLPPLAAAQGDERIIAYDFARLFIGPIFHTPRGIDRVDLAMARHLFSTDESPHMGIIPMPWGIRAFSAQAIRRWLELLESLWAENCDIDQDQQLRHLVARLAAPRLPTGSEQAENPAPTHLPALSRRQKIGRMLRHVSASGIGLGQSAAAAVPQKAIYLNIGQLGLAVPFFHHWLDGRRDLTRAMMLHDAIPLEVPHLVPPGADAHHARMVRTAARFADCLIFSSDCAQASVNKAMGELAQIRLPATVRPLPLPQAFCDIDTSLPDLAEVHYFIAVSTIELRKNYELLLRVWARLIARMGAYAPHLIIVGSPGFGAEKILAPLDTNPGLRQHIHIISGLSSPALSKLVLGASAMLCPSFTEGFGLPVLEANAMGVPTIASDIAAHREVGTMGTRYLDCDDDLAWEAAVFAMPRAGMRARPHIPARLTEANYCADIVKFVQNFSKTEQRQQIFGGNA